MNTGRWMAVAVIATAAGGCSSLRGLVDDVLKPRVPDVPVTNAPPATPEPPKVTPVPNPPAVTSVTPSRVFNPWHSSLDSGIYPEAWKFGDQPHRYDGRTARPREFRGWVRLTGSPEPWYQYRYHMRGYIEHLGVATVNNQPGNVMVSIDGNTLSWWVSGDAPPTGPEQPSVSVPEDPPAPPVSAPVYSTAGATLTVPGGNKVFNYNPASSRGTIKTVLRPGIHPAWVVAWGAGYQDQLKRTLPNEHDDMWRFYGSRPIAALPRPFWVRIGGLPGGDVYYVVQDPTKRISGLEPQREELD